MGGDPANMLRDIVVQLEPRSIGQLDEEHVANVISSGLVGNTRLKSLMITKGFSEFHVGAICFDSRKTLCDISSIESIHNSNHTLHRLRVYGTRESTFEMRCLQLNENTDKAKVIRDKILRFYFVGEFDVASFSNMAVSVLPEVMSQIKGYWRSEGKDIHSAVYRLLKCIPELCNVSERASSHQYENKRQKVV